MKIIVAAALFVSVLSASDEYYDQFYSQECMLHIRSNGSAVVEVAGHLYEAGFLGHSPECGCRPQEDDLKN